jgi:hypothetical protein
MTKTLFEIFAEAVAAFVDNVLTAFAWGIGFALAYLLIKALSLL